MPKPTVTPTHQQYRNVRINLQRTIDKIRLLRRAPDLHEWELDELRFFQTKLGAALPWLDEQVKKHETLLSKL